MRGLTVGDFYAPLDVDVAPLQCNTDSGDCGDSTRTGLRFGGTTVYDHQFRTTADGSFWIETANTFESDGSCSDTVGQFYQFIVASP